MPTQLATHTHVMMDPPGSAGALVESVSPNKFSINSKLTLLQVSKLFRMVKATMQCPEWRGWGTYGVLLMYSINQVPVSLNPLNKLN